MGRRSLSPAIATHLAQVFGSAPFSLDEAVGSGLTRDQVHRAVRVGTVRRLHPGVYAIPTPGDITDPTMPRAQQHALDSACGASHRLKGSAVSHTSAALLLGLPIPRGEAGDAHVTHPGARARITSGVRIHSAALPPEHIMIRDGLRLTNPARTAVDIARMSTIPEALICLDAVLRRTIEHTLYDATSLRLAVHDHSARQKAFAGVNSVITTQYRWTGVTSASSALRFADPAVESALESQSRGVLIAGGVPRPECGMPVTGASGRVYWVDMLWSQHGVIGECDGAVKYTAPDVLYREKLRQEDLERAGWRVVRWSYADVLRNPGRLIERILWALGPATF